MIPSIFDYYPDFTRDLLQACNQQDVSQKLQSSMMYSLEAGGKRVRPLLTAITCEEMGGDPSTAKPAALAIEMIHTYSLIHDDLPSMDDDDLRRGKPTNHIEFGQAHAILAGDGLQALAFDILTDPEWDISPEIKLTLVRNLAQASGSFGMVGGQALDLEFENQPCTLDQLQKIHNFKTGKLLENAIMAGCLLATTDQKKIQAMQSFGKFIGLAFQVADDILDITQSSETLGKNAGSDLENNKSTYPALLGIDGAKEMLEKLYNQSLTALECSGEPCSKLQKLAKFIVERTS